MEKGEDQMPSLAVVSPNHHRRRMIDQGYWYQPHVSRDGAEAILNTCTCNAFLVRKSSRNGFFAISSFSAADSAINHSLVRRNSTGQYIVQGNDDVSFNKLHDMALEAQKLCSYDPLNEDSFSRTEHRRRRTVSFSQVVLK